MKKLAFIYTTPNFYTALYRPVMSAAFDGQEDLQVCFTADTSMLLNTLANDGVPTPGVKKTLFRLMSNCADNGASCVVVGCTAVNTATKELSGLFDVPIVSVDEPMIQKALAGGHRRIAILSHNPVNAGTIRRRLTAEAPEAEIGVFVADGAPDAMAAADTVRYARLMQAQAQAAEDAGFDALVLGHISADPIDFSHISVPVYRTGSCCIEYIKKQLHLI